MALNEPLTVAIWYSEDILESARLGADGFQFSQLSAENQYRKCSFETQSQSSLLLSPFQHANLTVYTKKSKGGLGKTRLDFGLKNRLMLFP